MNALPILHMPHSAVGIPADVRASLRLSNEELDRELLLMTDWYTDELFALPASEAVTVRFPLSRLVLDPERFLDDPKEPMAARGMGAIYTRTSSGAILRDDPTPIERSDLIGRFYAPHHAALSDAVDSALKSNGQCLIIDCHSFPSSPLPYEQDQRPERPQVCLGRDPFHTPNWLVDIARNLICSHGFKVEINRPFSGALVPSKHFGREPLVFAIMIELNRKIYMNELTGAKLSGFSRVAAALKGTVRRLGHACSKRMAALQ
jgi:N-formylglutamate amidohydrolase